MSCSTHLHNHPMTKRISVSKPNTDASNLHFICLAGFKIEAKPAQFCAFSHFVSGIMRLFLGCELVCLLNWIQCVFTKLAQSSRNKSET